jgi:hypothetical protein
MGLAGKTELTVFPKRTNALPNYTVKYTVKFFRYIERVQRLSEKNQK